MEPMLVGRVGSGKLDDGALRPVAVVTGAVRISEKAAVAAVRRDDQLDVRVARQLWIAERLDGNEGVVGRRDDQRGDPDVLDDAEGGGAVVVVLGALESEEWRGVCGVELPHRTDAVQA